MNFIFDLHIHTIYSDGKATPNDVIEIAKKKNIGVAITDHNEIRGSIKGFELSKDVNYILGIEVGTKDGKEVLFYFDDIDEIESFYKKEIEPYKTNRMTRIERNIDEFLNKNYKFLFTTIPHPFGPLKKNIYHNVELSNKILDFVDCIEIFNYTQSKKSNQQALLLAKKMQKPMIASSDAHLIEDIGKGLTYLEIENNMINTKIIKTSEFDIANTIKTLFYIGISNFKYSILKERNV